MRALPHLGWSIAVFSVCLLHATRHWLGCVAFSCLLSARLRCSRSHVWSPVDLPIMTDSFFTPLGSSRASLQRASPSFAGHPAVADSPAAGDASQHMLPDPAAMLRTRLRSCGPRRPTPTPISRPGSSAASLVAVPPAFHKHPWVPLRHSCHVTTCTCTCRHLHLQAPLQAHSRQPSSSHGWSSRPCRFLRLLLAQQQHTPQQQRQQQQQPQQCLQPRLLTCPWSLPKPQPRRWSRGSLHSWQHSSRRQRSSTPPRVRQPRSSRFPSVQQRRSSKLLPSCLASAAAAAAVACSMLPMLIWSRYRLVINGRPEGNMEDYPTSMGCHLQIKGDPAVRPWTQFTIPLSDK
ncbi:hypothetical protein COO60DRAFT_377435 [Scenedesmus sp. NREL 46B-D3]|nr:hypothetical protein COO60DRAFT_377435 [Scenedesmus sp. NREL 46B-D3]